MPSIAKPKIVSAAQAVIAAGCLAYVAQALFAICGAAASGAFENVLYPALLAGCGALCAARAALVRQNRAPWALFAVGLLLWAAGDVYATEVLVEQSNPPLASIADVLWVAFYPAAYLALMLLARARLAGGRRLLWLDALVGVGAITAAGMALSFSPLLAGLEHAPHVVAADLTYLLGDVLLIAFVTMFVALTGWSFRGVWPVLIAGLTLAAVADALSVYEAATGANLGGTAFAAFAPLGALLLSLAAWRAPQDTPVALSGWRLLVMPASFAVVALGVVVAALFDAVHNAAALVATVTLAAVIVRMTWTYAENMQVLARSRHEALTDALTGLGNRRKLLGDLDHACRDTGTFRTLLLFDLDGFKGYNDAFGHPAGDALLTRFGAALRETLGDIGEAYRLGGDEFCVLIDATGKAAEAIRTKAMQALSDRGSGFAVTTSCGGVEVPIEAADTSQTLKIADERLYAQKASRRTDASHTLARDVLLQAIRECEPDLEDHSTEVAGTAATIAARMGMTEEQTRSVERAAELHDVGKVAVPDAILNKPGALDHIDWQFVRQHTLIGQRILSAAPVLRPIAELVRSSHERFDGTGYPDRLAGTDIPLGARIIAVCDAYNAMVSDRPYRSALAHQEAIAELRRCAGTQFDPRVVDAFCDTITQHQHAAIREPSFA